MNNNRSRKYIYPVLLNHIEQGKNFVLATVVETSGSVPQKPGSAAIFGKKQFLQGTIGGGAVEYEIQKIAAEAVDTKKSGYYRFELDDEITEDNSVICGGGMRILLDASPEKHTSVFKELAESYQNRIPGVLLTMGYTDEKEDFEIERTWINRKNLNSVSDQLDGELVRQVTMMLEETSSGKPTLADNHKFMELEDKYIFLERIIPLPRLIIAGAGHVGKALAPIGKLLEFEVTVWDDREEYANKKNIPDADVLMAGEFSKTLAKLVPHPDTFLVIVTRGHKNDSQVLKQFINSNAGYIGMIGSRNKTAQMKQQFLKEGWSTPEQWGKIYAPIGLKIHSKTIQEIAISIAAQLIQVRHQLNYGKE